VWHAASDRRPLALVGHTGAVNGCAFGPDGRWIVSAGADHTLRTWDAADGHVIASWTAHDDGVVDCAVSPDGTIASASEDGTVKLWLGERGGEVATLGRHTSRARACAFTPDGRYLVSAGEDATTRLWSVRERREVATLPLTAMIWSLAVHPLVARVACGLWTGEICEADLVGIEYEPSAASTTAVAAEPRGTEAGSSTPALRTTLDPLMAFIGAGSWQHCRRVLEENAVTLLSSATLAALDDMLELADSASVRHELLAHRHLLEMARRDGLDRAFAGRRSTCAIFEARDRLDAVVEFVGAETWAESRAILDDHPDLLLSDEVDGVFAALIEANRANSAAVEIIEQCRDLLAACRRDGVDRAFDNVLR
jgi:hypothetical protein